MHETQGLIFYIKKERKIKEEKAVFKQLYSSDLSSIVHNSPKSERNSNIQRQMNR